MVWERFQMQSVRTPGVGPGVKQGRGRPPLALGSFLLLSSVLLNLPVFSGARIGNVENNGREQTSAQRIQERSGAEEGKNDRKKMATGEYEVYANGSPHPTRLPLRLLPHPP